MARKECRQDPSRLSVEQGLPIVAATTATMVNTMKNVFYTEKDTLFIAHEKIQGGIPLSKHEASRVSLINSLLAEMYFTNLPCDFEDTTSDLGIVQYHGDAIRNRTIELYRNVDYLRLLGSIREEALDGNKLFLGAGSVVCDVFPFVFQFSFPGVNQMKDFYTYFEQKQYIYRNFQSLIDSGTINMKQRKGNILGIDNDSHMLHLGLQWASQIGINTNGCVMNVLDFFKNFQVDLSKSDISLIAALRVDPLILGGDIESNKEKQRRIKSFVDPIVNLIRNSISLHGTQFIASIGSGQLRGNSIDGSEIFQNRQRLLSQIENHLRQSRLPSVKHLNMTRFDPMSSWISPTLRDLEILIADSYTHEKQSITKK